jgi:hypothetical protein
MKLLRLSLVSLAVCAVTYGWTQMNLPNAKQVGRVGAFSPGRVAHIPFVYLCPARLNKACDLLLNRELGQAWQLFRKDLDEHPTNLSAWVGLMQCDYNAWPGEIMRLEDAVKRGTGDSVNRFKLGTLLLWQWAVQEPGKPKDYPDKQRDRAMALLESAWNAEHDPLYGMMLCEVYECLTGEYAYRQTSAIIDALLRDLAGPAAYKQYHDAATQGWPLPSPKVELTPAANRRAVLAPISCLWSRASARGMLVVDRGKPVRNPQYAPPTPEQANRQRWFTDWRDSLRRSAGFLKP